MNKRTPGNAEDAENGQEARTTAKAASGAGFTPAERAVGLGGAPLAPPSSVTTVGRRQVLQGLLAGVGAAIPGATAAHPLAQGAPRPAAVQAAAAKAKLADWKPEFLDAHQLATVQALCERIVPGALAARSDRFIDALLAVDTRDNKQRFLSALGAMEGEARRRFGQPFKLLSEAQQGEILSAAATDKPGREDWVWTPGTIMKQPEPGPPKTTPRDHFDNLKQWIAGAYYSSEAGAKELGSTGQMFFASFPDCDHEGGHSG